MIQGKLDVVKQEMASVNINILGISELKWIGMGKFNSDDHFIYYSGQEFLGRNGVALIVNRGVWNAILGCSLKNDRMISVHFQGKPFTVIQVDDPTTSAKEAQVARFYEDLQDLLELTPKKKTKNEVLFIIGDWNAKVGSQEIPRIIGKFGFGVQNEEEKWLIRVLSREHAGHRKTLFQQNKRLLYTWTSSDCQYWNQIDYILCSKDGKALYSQQKQNLELTVAQIISSLLQNSGLNWTKVGKINRQFRYNLNQICYDYTVEVINRFRGWDPVDRVLEELWTEVHNIVQEAATKTTPNKKKCEKVKWFS